jgi:hypothetical protein
LLGGLNALAGGVGDLGRTAIDRLTSNISGLGLSASADYGLGPLVPLGEGATIGANRWGDRQSTRTVTYGSFNSSNGHGGWSFGAHCSAGTQLPISNTGNLSDILGKFHNLNLNAGALANVSLTISWSDTGTFVVTPQYGLGVGASVSAYDTDTIVGRQ